MSIPISALYASLCGFLMIGLALLVVRDRRGKRVGMGSGGDERLQRAIRAHGNFVEYVPLALLLLLIAELGGSSAMWLHLNGGVLVIARLAHAWGLSHSAGTSFGRFWGTALTWTVVLVLSGSNLWNALSQTL